MKEHLRELVAQSLLDLRRHGRLDPALATPDFVVERTKSREHGDYASNIALLLAKPAGMKPRELAELLVNTLPSSQHVEKVERRRPRLHQLHPGTRLPPGHHPPRVRAGQGLRPRGRPEAASR